VIRLCRGSICVLPKGLVSIDAAVRIQGDDRAGIERLLRYCARPPFALERLHAPGGTATLASPEARLLYRFPRQRLDEHGPGGFDPEPFLEAMDVPGLWIFGGLDLSVPVDRSVRNLERIRDEFGKGFTSVVIPDLNHSWVRDGTVCQQEGPGGIDGHVTYDWLAARFQLR
jgi:pimeloyl-ACP methyl ester carboxylesterase